MSTFQIVSYPETQSLALGTEFVRSMVDLDARVFGTLDPRDLGTAQSWTELLRHRPDTATVALDAAGALIGHIDTFPVTPAASDAIKCARLHDGDFRPEHVVPSGAPVSRLYVMTVAVAPEWRGRGIARALWNRAAAYWARCSPEEVLTTVWSPEGRRFFAPNARRRVALDEHGHEILDLAFAPLPPTVIAA